MDFSSTADGFIAAVKALRSLDGRGGVSFYTFTLPEERCVRLLVKNLGRGMPESVVREELDSLNIHVQGVSQLRSGRRDQDPAKDRPPTPISSYQCRENPSCLKCDHSPNSADCECRWSRTWLQRDHCNVSAANASATRSAAADTHRAASLVGMSTPREQPQCCGCGGNHTANYRGFVNWKEVKASLAKQAPDRSRKSVATGQPVAPKAQRASPSAEQMELA